MEAPNDEAALGVGAEEQLAMLRSLVDKTPLGLIVYRVESDTDPGRLRLVLANEHAGVAAGTDIKRLIGQTMREAYPSYIETGQPQRVLDEVWHARKTIDLGTLVYGDETIQRGVYQASAFPVFERYVCIAYSNITAQYELQARLDAKAIALEHANRALERSNASLAQFAYIASHDLQEPLRKIRAFGDRIQASQRARLEPKYADYLDRMVNAAGRMSTLISDLLMYSRVHSSPSSLDAVDPSTILTSVVDDLEISITEAQATVSVDPVPGRVLGDQTRLRQLFQNLLSNALKFRREGVVPEISVSAALDRGYLAITVRDNGIGFDPRYADRIFKPFQRLHTRAEYPGTGIGLAVCHEIAVRHGGSLSVESKPGEGSAFTVRLKEAR
ncbi:sensor histidine kinase [Paraliomyxa miuraensis]|uniref:sensor histidine kinase n=1 Tax=Paraliomyxa miuraensis TaxID=376150 RepID=UPI002259CC82|nr:ATP-binding protein [Paraliomyxa miuraensis]MCX4244381.1 ATP-binding protein [Paraliomyxa miuraensis]